MGNALALLGCVGIVVGFVALIRGRMGWARIGSRKAAAFAILGSVLALVVGAVIAAPAPSRVAQPSAGTAPADTSPGPATSIQATTAPTPGSQLSEPPGTPLAATSTPPTSALPSSGSTRVLLRATAAPSSIAVTVVAADVQQAGERRAVALLAALPVRGREPLTGYSRRSSGKPGPTTTTTNWAATAATPATTFSGGT